MPENASERPHGYARYKLDNCRCYTCGFAMSEYERARQRAIAYGTWQPFVDAAPVREHIQMLRSCNVGIRRIAQLAGEHRGAVRHIAVGKPGKPPVRQTRPDRAARILAVEPTLANVAPHTPVDGFGTTRRLQALVAQGFTQAHLGARMNMTGGNFGAMLRAPRVTATKALEARALYEELWQADPLEHGVTLRGLNRARKIAAANRWAPPGAWDDDQIDDPDAFPDWTGHCGKPEGYHAHRQARIPTCRPCLDAQKAVSRERRAAAKRAATEASAA